MKKLLLGVCSFASLLSYSQTNTSSIEFQGIDKYVNVPNNSVFDVDDFTVSFWIKQDVINTGDYMFPISKDCTGCETTNGDWAFFLRDGEIQFGVQNVAVFNWGNTCTSSVITDGTWHYISGTRNNSTGVISLYVDGVMVDSKNEFIGTINNTSPILIAKYSTGSNNYPADFFLDDISIWNSALGQTEIQDNMDCPPVGTEQNLIAFWNFEEGTGTTAGDVTSNNNDGTLTNGPVWSNDAPYYNCGLGIGELQNGEKELVKIVDLMGRETSPQKNKVLIYIYSDGTTERIFEFE